MATKTSTNGELRQRAVNGSSKAAENLVAPSDEGKKIDQKLDQHLEYVPPFRHYPGFFALTRFRHRYEFGGPWGVVAIMTGFPILMYYLWICLVYYDGQLVFPASVDDIQPFLWRMWDHVCEACSTHFVFDASFIVF